MGNAWPKDNKGLVLKHCSVLSSSKYEAKFAFLWNENVLWMHCVSSVVDHVTSPKL